MPEKKKPPTAYKNIDRRMTKPQASKTAKASEPARTPAHGAAPAPVLDGPKQLDSFEGAMKLFHARQLKEARHLFQLAAVGPGSDVANRARMQIGRASWTEK